MQRPPRRRIRKLASFTLTDEEREALAALAKKRGVPKSHIVGRLILREARKAA
jgi:predicted DNA-binding protein